MLLLTGPPGSGKTNYILEQVRQAIRSGAGDVRLLTPTATMAEHLRHELAREGYLVPGQCVQTLFQFVEGLADGPPRASRPLVRRLVGRALEQDPPEQLRVVASYPGLRSALTDLIDELSLAGCSPEQLINLQRNRNPAGELAAAVGGLFRRVEDEIKRRGAALRSHRLERARRRVEAGSVRGVKHLLWDGFFSFSQLELELVVACSRMLDVTLSLPDWDGARRSRERLLAAGFRETRYETTHRQSRKIVYRAENLDQEVREVARRILAEASAGKPFREMGIVVRGASVYVAAFRNVFGRFGIPARFYSPEPLTATPVVRRLSGIVEGILDGWDARAHLPALLMSPATPELDRFEFAMREKMPSRGLSSFQDPALRGSIARLVRGLEITEGWRDARAEPREWAKRLIGLAELFPPPPIADRLRQEEVEIWRRHTTSVKTFREVTEQTAKEMEGEPPAPLKDFWEQVRTALEMTSLYERDRRRNVVHVMDAYEARQWELPVVFVCGLLEKEFPRHHSENSLLPDAARRALARGGVHLKTTEQWGQEERFLFALATTRATETLVLSYPAYDAKGNENLPSFLLSELIAPEQPERAGKRHVRPASARTPVLVRRRQVIADPMLQEELTRRRSWLNPSAIERFLQCPFQFFAERSLALTGRPAAPGERLDPLVQGTIAHRVLAELIHGETPDKHFPEVFERIFQEECEQAGVPPGYRREQARLELRRDLQGLLSDGIMEPWGKPRTEESFEMELADGVGIRGRIDRIDEAADGRLRVIDYKYSRPEKARKYVAEHNDGLRVQAGLYARAVREVAGRALAAVHFCAFRGGVKCRGWTGPDAIAELIKISTHKTLEVASEISEGRIEPVPAGESTCEYCDYSDICRVETAEPEVRAGGEVA